MEEDRIRYLEEAIQVVVRQIELLKGNKRVNSSMIDILEEQKTQFQMELLNLKYPPKQQPSPLFGILNTFDDDEFIQLPTQEDKK